ncbi:conserved Plasmodium protein, unknown function [Plasmodium ovale curtisi]|uniref:Uncharacterized protein n=1 Tax=Plasmodium ovale curtisi TaxID=864141 RepID=A0A1A8WKU9_PLAOA|nr:conserved Plasmodium protein, unknown function [Plasmodium ovale curtisi]
MYEKAGTLFFPPLVSYVSSISSLFIIQVKHNLLVEPEIIRKKWCLSIGTCIQIENNSSLYFRIYKEGKTKYFSRVNFKWKLRKNKKCKSTYPAWAELDIGTNNEGLRKNKKNGMKYNTRHNNKNVVSYIEKKKKKERSKNGDYINILPFSKRAIPLFWLYDCSLPYIKILRKKEKKYDMNHLRKNYDEENLDIEAVPFHILYKLLNKYALSNNNIYHKKLDISPSELVFKSLIMFYCFVRVKDVPTQHIKETSYNYTVVIEPMVTIKNNLPNPITVIVRLKKEKGLFNINKNKVEDKFFYKTNNEMSDDITKILKKQELYALVPPHHFWCLPICTQAFYMKVFYHGLQIEKMNFICNYANEIRSYFDYKDVKLPDLNEALYSGDISHVINKTDKLNVNESNGTNGGNKNRRGRDGSDTSGGNSSRNGSNDNPGNVSDRSNFEEHRKNVNYLQYRSGNRSDVTTESFLMYDRIIRELHMGEKKRSQNESDIIDRSSRSGSDGIYTNEGYNPPYHFDRGSFNSMLSLDDYGKDSYHDGYRYKHNFLYATESFFPIYMSSTDTITSTKVLNHKCGLIGNIFSYDELKFIYFENKISQMNRKIYDNLHIFKTITISADVSRRKIDFYFPFFFENTTNVCIYVNSKLLPPNSRLYMTEEEAKNVRIKSYKQDHVNNKILCSNVSSKIDCTKTNMIRPLVNLVYRKISRKQRVRFWEKYEERKKKHTLVANSGDAEQEEKNSHGDEKKRDSNFKLSKIKGGTAEKFIRVGSSVSTGGIPCEGDLEKKSPLIKNHHTKDNEDKVDTLLGSSQNGIAENYNGNSFQERFSDLYYKSTSKKGIIYCNSKYSEFSVNGNEEKGEERENERVEEKNKKSSRIRKRYRDAFKHLIIRNKKLFKQKKKLNEKASSALKNIKKMKAFRLFKKKEKGNKMNADREDEEYFEDTIEQEPFERNDDESGDSASYEDDENDKKEERDENGKSTRGRNSRRGKKKRGKKYHIRTKKKKKKTIFSTNLYTFDKYGKKYFNKCDNASKLGSNDSLFFENEENAFENFPPSDLSCSIPNLFKEEKELLNDEECDEEDDNEEDGNEEDGNEEDGNEEDGNEEDGNEEDGNEEDGNEEDGNEEDGNEEDGNEEDGNEEDESAKRSRKIFKHDAILKFNILKKRGKRKKHKKLKKLKKLRAIETEKKKKKMQKSLKKYRANIKFRRKRFHVTPFFSSIDKRYKYSNDNDDKEEDISLLNNLHIDKISSNNYHLDDNSTDSSNSMKDEKDEVEFIASKEGKTQGPINGKTNALTNGHGNVHANNSRVTFSERTELRYSWNQEAVETEKMRKVVLDTTAGVGICDDPGDKAVQQPKRQMKKRKSLRDISRNKRERSKSKIKKKDFYEGGFLSIGICVRYAEEPFNKSKIVTFVNCYMFINRLPFDIKIVTDYVRKSDSIFANPNVVNNIGFNRVYKEIPLMEGIKSNNNFSNTQPLPLDRDINERNISDTNNGVKESEKAENCGKHCGDNHAELEAFKVNDNALDISGGNVKNVSSASNSNFIVHVDGDEKGKKNVEEAVKDTLSSEKEKVFSKQKMIAKNETYIRSGEITSFHYHRSYIKIKDKTEEYSSLPFSLIPKNVPSNFQIELFNINKSQINNTNNLLVEVNVCSGIFGDKQQLPYTYNGYFYILSLPVRPQFEIINATKFIIAYATDVNKYTKKYMNNNYDTYLNRSNKNGEFPVKMIYPYSSIYYTLRHNNEIESSKIALKIVGVQKSSWCINSMNSFIDNVVVLPYRVYGDKMTSRNSWYVQKGGYDYRVHRGNHGLHGNYSGRRNRMGNVNREKDKSFIEFNTNDSATEGDNNDHIFDGRNRGKEKVQRDSVFLGHNLVNKKLYSFLIIRDNGSRAIVITEKYNLARKIVSTKNFSKIHKLIALNSRKKILMSSKNENRKHILDYKRMNFLYFNFPNVPIVYKINIPRLTVTWIHRQDVMIAIHLTKLKYSGHISPKEIINNDMNQMFIPINILKKKELEEYIQFVFLNSYIDSIFLIEQIHIDHFVKGDIPVILKNTNIEENENEDIFLYIHIKQYCVDSFKQAPIYQSISIKISPLNANIELLVIEQLIEIIEKEKQLLLLHEKEDHKSLPPLIATSETAKNAINTTLKIFSDSNFLKMLRMDNYIKRKMENNFLLQNNKIGNNNIIVNSVHRNENSYRMIMRNKKQMENNDGEMKLNAYSYYFSSPEARMITQNKIVNINNISEKLCLENSTNSSSNTNVTHKNKKYEMHKKLCKVLVGYYKYKKVHNLINNTYYDINNKNDERLLPIKIQYFKNRKIFMNSFSSHLFLHPNPRWIDNKSKPVYIRDFKIYPIEIIASIRTSEHRISRRILHIVDALPVDTPSMRIHLISQKRNYIVCTWDGLFQSLRISYFRQLLRQSLPSAWLSNPFAFIKGFIKGLFALFKETIRGVKTSSNCFDGFMSGFKCGIIILVVNTVGGLFQSLSHMLNVCHKLMGGSRPRPPSILDSIILGFDGLLLDTFYRPWVSLFTEPKVSLNKGNSTLKTSCIVIGCILRCLFSPLFGLLNFFASITEGFANTLIGDFERFSRVQERAEFETETSHKVAATMRKGRSLKRLMKRKPW